MLIHPLLFTKPIGWYENKEGTYSRNSMLPFQIFMEFPSADYYSHLRIYRRNYILAHPVLFTKSFGWYGNKEVNYSRNYIISYTLFISVPSEYCYLSTECIYHKFYGTSSCVIYKIYWLGRQQGRYLYQTLYVRFSTIRGSPFSRL